MKWLLLSTLLCSQITFSQNDYIKPVKVNNAKNILKFIAGTKILRDLSLYQIMKNRCNRYSHQPSECARSVGKLIQAIDFDMEILDPVSANEQKPWEIEKFVFAAFKDILLQVLDSNKITTYLNGVNKGLNGDIATVKNFNIWTYTLNFFDRDIYVAAGVIATLFQDTSMAVTHVEYMNYVHPNTSSKTQKNLDILTDIIIKIALLEEDHNQLSKQILFPRNLNSKYFTSIYHFYVPYFLTMKLRKQFKVTQFNAKEASMMLNLTYEFVTADQEYKYLFKDPEILELKKYQHKLQDIYSGYIAINYATDEVFATTSFHELATAFSLSTNDAVKDYVLIR